MKKWSMFVLLIACLMLFSGIASSKSNDNGEDDVCEKSPGYWKNHLEEWPVEEIEIGGATYLKADAIDLMSTPVSGDKTYTLFRALVAAKLNVLSDCTNCCEISSTIGAADIFMTSHPGGSGLAASSSCWQDRGEDLYVILDKYNNGMFDC